MFSFSFLKKNLFVYQSTNKFASGMSTVLEKSVYQATHIVTMWFTRVVSKMADLGWDLNSLLTSLPTGCRQPLLLANISLSFSNISAFILFPTVSVTARRRFLTQDGSSKANSILKDEIIDLWCVGKDICGEKSMPCDMIHWIFCKPHFLVRALEAKAADWSWLPLLRLMEFLSAEACRERSQLFPEHCL